MVRLNSRMLVALMVALGISLGVLTAIGVYVTVQQTSALRAQTETSSVVVPVHPIIAHSQIRAEDVTLQQEHRSDVPPQAATVVADVVGKVALTDLYPGQAVLTPQVTTPDNARSLGYTLPAGMEAIELPTPDLVSGAGAIAPGDRIDVILTVPSQAGDQKTKMTQFALQGIQVIGVGQVLPATGGKSTNGEPTVGTVTVLVTPQQALLLSYAKDSVGEGVTINLALRRPDDSHAYATDAVSLDYLRHYLEQPH